MTVSPTHRRRWLAPCLAALGLTWATAASADVETCVESHSRGQLLRDEGKLLESQTALLACASDTACPTPIREECEQFLATVQRLTPTMVFAGRDHLGRDIDGVRVYMNDVVLDWVAGNPPIAVDAGAHVVRFEHPDGRVIEQTVHAVQGEKARLVVAEFSVTEPLKVPSASNRGAGESSPPSEVRELMTYAFGGLAVVGLAGFVVFGLQGKSEEKNLRNSCAPNCTSDQKHAVAQKYLWADVSLAVAGLSLAGGAVLYFAPLSANDRAASISFTGEF